MKYRIVLTFYIVLVQGQVIRNFRLVLNEMGPGRTSRAWDFHSSAQMHNTVQFCVAWLTNSCYGANQVNLPVTGIGAERYTAGS